LLKHSILNVPSGKVILSGSPLLPTVTQEEKLEHLQNLLQVWQEVQKDMASVRYSKTDPARKRALIQAAQDEVVKAAAALLQEDKTALDHWQGIKLPMDDIEKYMKAHPSSIDKEIQPQGADAQSIHSPWDCRLIQSHLSRNQHLNPP
jgi:hypothetical protein